jgi:hypothetical protein
MPNAPKPYTKAELAAKLAKMDPKDRARLLELEAQRRNLKAPPPPAKKD